MVRVSVALILVVDDEFGVAEVLETILADVGHEVVTAANGRQALERAKERLPDLVLLDFMMPIMDGPSVLKAMRKAPALRNIPAVIMSSLPESAISKSVGGMYAAFVRKPFRLNTVLDTVNVVLGQQR
jgi:CheY-like chemotaxis protein